jgi:hypothetical protein
VTAGVDDGSRQRPRQAGLAQGFQLGVTGGVTVQMHGVDGTRHQSVILYQQGGEGAATLPAVAKGQLQRLLQPHLMGGIREGGQRGNEASAGGVDRGMGHERDLESMGGADQPSGGASHVEIK